MEIIDGLTPLLVHAVQLFIIIVIRGRYSVSRKRGPMGVVLINMGYIVLDRMSAWEILKWIETSHAIDVFCLTFINIYHYIPLKHQWVQKKVWSQLVVECLQRPCGLLIMTASALICRWVFWLVYGLGTYMCISGMVLNDSIHKQCNLSLWANAFVAKHKRIYSARDEDD